MKNCENRGRIGDVMSTEGKEFIVKTKKEILRFECCDCSLTHDFEFDIKNKKEIGITIKRNNYSTAQHRRFKRRGNHG